MNVPPYEVDDCWARARPGSTRAATTGLRASIMAFNVKSREGECGRVVEIERRTILDDW